MKTLGKISINPDKILKNDELINLQGGGCDCTCFDPYYMFCYGYLYSPEANCIGDCNYVFGGSTIGQCGNLYSYCVNQ